MYAPWGGEKREQGSPCENKSPDHKRGVRAQQKENHRGKEGKKNGGVW